jgi:hypothetical protein
MNVPNSHDALVRRRDTGLLTWRGPALMLFARSACAVGAQALVAGVFALRSSPTPWRDSEPWLPVYGTLIGLALIPVALLFILGGIYASVWLVYGRLSQPYVFGSLPLPANALWRAGVSVHLGTDRADDVQRLSGAALPGARQHAPLGGVRGVFLVHAAVILRI